MVLHEKDKKWIVELMTNLTKAFSGDRKLDSHFITQNMKRICPQVEI
jgi:hypothetical protein